MTEVFDAGTIVLLITAGALGVGRLVRPGSSLPDRVIGSDMLVVVVTTMVIAATAALDRPSFLPIAVAVALLGLVGTITVARYVEKRGARP